MHLASRDPNVVKHNKYIVYFDDYVYNVFADPVRGYSMFNGICQDLKTGKDIKPKYAEELTVGQFNAEVSKLKSEIQKQIKQYVDQLNDKSSITKSNSGMYPSADEFITNLGNDDGSMNLVIDQCSGDILRIKKMSHPESLTITEETLKIDFEFMPDNHVEMMKKMINQQPDIKFIKTTEVYNLKGSQESVQFLDKNYNPIKNDALSKEYMEWRYKDNNIIDNNNMIVTNSHKSTCIHTLLYILSQKIGRAHV